MKNANSCDHSMLESGDNLEPRSVSARSSPFSKLSMFAFMNSIVNKISRTATQTPSPKSVESSTTECRDVTVDCSPVSENVISSRDSDVRIHYSFSSAQRNMDYSDGFSQATVEKGLDKARDEFSNVTQSISANRSRGEMVSGAVKNFEEHLGSRRESFSRNHCSFEKATNVSSNIKLKSTKHGRLLPQFRRETRILNKSISESAIDSPPEYSILPSCPSPFTGRIGLMPAVRLSPRPPPQLLNITDRASPVTVKVSQPDPLRSPFHRYQPLENVDENRPLPVSDSFVNEAVAEALRKRKRSGIDQNESEARLSDDSRQPLKRRRSRNDLDSANPVLCTELAAPPPKNSLARGLKRRALRDDSDVQMVEESPNSGVSAASKKVCQQSSPPAALPPRRYACGAKSLIDASYTSIQRYEKRLHSESSCQSSMTSIHDESILSPDSRITSRQASPCSSQLSRISQNTNQVQMPEDGKPCFKLGVPRSGPSSCRSSPLTVLERSLESDLGASSQKQLLLIRDGNSKNRVTILGSSSATEIKLDFDKAKEAQQNFVLFTADDLERDRLLLSSRADWLLSETGFLENETNVDVQQPFTVSTGASSSQPQIATLLSSTPVSNFATPASQGVQLQQSSGITTSNFAKDNSVEVEKTPAVSFSSNIAHPASQILIVSSSKLPVGSYGAGNSVVDVGSSTVSSAKSSCNSNSLEKHPNATAGILRDVHIAGSSLSSSDQLKANGISSDLSKPSDVQKMPELKLGGFGASTPSIVNLGSGSGLTSLPVSATTSNGSSNVTAFAFGSAQTFGSQNNTIGAETANTLSTGMWKWENDPNQVINAAATAGSLSNSEAANKYATQTATGGFVFEKVISCQANAQNEKGGFAFGKTSVASAAATCGSVVPGNSFTTLAMTNSNTIQSTSGFAFDSSGATQTTASGFAFGSSGATKTTSSGFAFGSSGATQTTASGIAFGSSGATKTTSSDFAFGSSDEAQTTTSGFAFGSSGATQTTASGIAFGSSSATQVTAGNFVFCSSSAVPQTTANVVAFGSSGSMHATGGGGGGGGGGFTFGNSIKTQTSVGGFVFGGNSATHTNASLSQKLGSTKPASSGFSSESQKALDIFSFGNLNSTQNASNGFYNANQTRTFTFGKTSNTSTSLNQAQNAASGSIFGSSHQNTGVFVASTIANVACNPSFGNQTSANVFTFGGNPAANSNIFGTNQIDSAGFSTKLGTGTPFGASTAGAASFGQSLTMSNNLANKGQNLGPAVLPNGQNAADVTQSAPQDLRRALFQQTPGSTSSTAQLATGFNFFGSKSDGNSSSTPSGGFAFGQTQNPVQTFGIGGSGGFPFNQTSGNNPSQLTTNSQAKNQGFTFQAAVQPGLNPQTPAMSFNFPASLASTPNFTFGQQQNGTPGIAPFGASSGSVAVIPKFTPGASSGMTRSSRARKKLGK